MKKMDPVFSDDRKSATRYVAFFDLDRTITGKISGKALVRMAWKKNQISLTDLFYAAYLYLLFKLRIRNPLQVIDKMVEWVKGKPEEWIAVLCHDVCREYLLPSIFSEAARTISLHKQNNASVVILSSALSPICAEVSEYLGMDGFLCSTLEVKDGYLTGKSSGRLCFGDEKLSRMKEFCKNNTMNPSGSWYYGDSISDFPALASVGNPVCVNPDLRLKKAARKRGWKIVIWKD